MSLTEYRAGSRPCEFFIPSDLLPSERSVQRIRPSEQSSEHLGDLGEHCAMTVDVPITTGDNSSKSDQQ